MQECVLLITERFHRSTTLLNWLATVITPWLTLSAKGPWISILQMTMAMQARVQQRQREMARKKKIRRRSQSQFQWNSWWDAQGHFDQMPALLFKIESSARDNPCEQVSSAQLWFNSICIGAMYKWYMCFEENIAIDKENCVYVFFHSFFYSGNLYSAASRDFYWDALPAHVNV